jgi:hypothetical protein
MIRPPRRAACLSAAIIAVLCLATPAVAAAAEETTITYTTEPITTWEAQLNGKQIEKVTVNKFVRTLRTTLKDGTHVLAKYPRKGEKPFIAKLEAAHVPVSVLTPTQARSEAKLKKKPVKHKIRYIVGGVLIVVIVIGGIVLLLRRRRSVAD